MRVLMAPCSWEKENLRGQRKDLISHTMIAFRTWRQVLLSITLVIDLILSAYKEFCSDTESYPHTQMDLGSCDSEI